MVFPTHCSSRRRPSAWDGTSGYSPDTRVWVSRRPQAPGGKPKGPPSGKAGKPTWEADENQKQHPLRGSARAVKRGLEGGVASEEMDATDPVENTPKELEEMEDTETRWKRSATQDVAREMNEML